MSENHENDPVARSHFASPGWPEDREDAPPVASLLYDDDFQEHGTPEQVTALYKALASARGQFRTLERNRTVHVEGVTKTGKPFSYDFDYADLGECLDATTPALSGNGLCVIFPPARPRIDGPCRVRMVLAHEGGGKVVASFVVSAEGDIKDFGGRLTYARRYLYTNTLNIAADADADDQPTREQETSASGRDRKQRTPPAPPEARPQAAPRAQQARQPAPAPRQASSEPEAPPPVGELPAPPKAQSEPPPASEPRVERDPEPPTTDELRETAEIRAACTEIAKQLGYNREAFRTKLGQWFSVGSVDELSMAQKREMRVKLQAELDRKNGAAS